ncbi:MAG: DNA repair protein RecO [Verrucomicrobia bacterium]|nr:DNA repair protein RecO [Verrucomicrobiota bacterium]
MSDERAVGVILRTRPLTETSLIAYWLTAEQGRVATVAKGARRPKSPFRGKLDLFHVADFTFARSRRSDLHTLREMELLRTHGSLRTDLGKLEKAAYFAGFIELATESDTPIPEFHDLMIAVLGHLDSFPATSETVIGFEIQALDLLGLSPDWSRVRIPEPVKKLAVELAHFDWSQAGVPTGDGRWGTALKTFLHGFLIQHLGRLPYGRSRAHASEPTSRS